MKRALSRVVFYVLLSIACIGIAVVFTESRTAFISVFSLGILFGLTAELLFWDHLYRLFSNRR